MKCPTRYWTEEGYLPCCVVKCNQILTELGGDADSDGYNGHVVDGDIQAEGDEEEAAEEQQESNLVEGFGELVSRQLLGRRRISRFQCQIGNNEECHYEKSARSHGPRISDFVDECADENREDDTAQTGASSQHAESETSTLMKPAAGASESAHEDGGGANGATDTLRQQKLVVLCCEGRHHETKDVEE